MPRGFFHKSQLTTRKAPPSLVPKCGSCGLFQSCLSPKMPTGGEGDRRILIVGNMPTASEDESGRHFTGPAGQLLERSLLNVGINLRKDCTLTNALICYPSNNPVKDVMVDYCRPNLIQTIRQTSPEVIVPLGDAAVKSVLGHLYKDEDLGTINKWAGWQIPCQKLNVWICPTFDPDYVLSSDRNPVPGLVFRRHLRDISKLSGRPWDVVPDYPSQVERIFNPRKAAIAIREFLNSRLLAFDYETTTLKPEYEGAAIVCCSLSDGKRTIAFPWIGETIEAMQEIIRSDIPKIASNLKFEERWTRWYFGHGVTNWKWDTMVAAHCIDNRPKITSIKFQSFVLLGAEPYDEHVKKQLRVQGQETNEVKEEVELDQLLTYNGLDSLLEYKVARIQMRLIGVAL